MGNQKEKTLDELVRKTRKISEPRPSCVLEGKARMRGPGVHDTSDDAEIIDAESIEVCESCGIPVLEADLRLCSVCDQGFHTACLEQTLNASSSLDWLCSRCISTSSQLHLATEVSPNSTSGISGQKEMTAVLEPKVDVDGTVDVGGQDGLSKGGSAGSALSGSQDNSYEEHKFIASVDDDVKTVDQLEGGATDMTELASCGGLEDLRKIFHTGGESDKQSPVPDPVRRSKRGRPYKPVGGLHPNKRRSVDNSFRHSDGSSSQGRVKPVADEEDELGAKIEKFRVISSIDENNLRRGALGREDMKGLSSGCSLILEEQGRGVQGETSMEVDNDTIRKLSGSGLATECTGLVDNPISGDETKLDESKLDEDGSISTVPFEAVKLELVSTSRDDFTAQKENIDNEEITHKLDDSPRVGMPAGICTESLIPSLRDSDIGREYGNRLSRLGDQKESQQNFSRETIRFEHGQEQMQGKVNSSSAFICDDTVSEREPQEQGKEGKEFRDPVSPVQCRVKEESSNEVVVEVQGIMKTESASSTEMSGPVTLNTENNSTSETQEVLRPNQPLLAEPNVVNPPCSSSITNRDLEYPPSQASPTSVLRAKSQLVGIPPTFEPRSGCGAVVSETVDAKGTDIFSEALKSTFSSSHQAIPRVVLTEQDTSTTEGSSESCVKETLRGSPNPTLSTLAHDEKIQPISVGVLEPVGVKDTTLLSSLQSKIDNVVATSPEQTYNHTQINDLVAESLPSGEKLNLDLPQSVRFNPSGVKLMVRTESGGVPSLAATSATSAVHTGTTHGDSINVIREGQLPDSLRSGSGSSEEEELCRGSQSGSLEEEDDVKVCDICGDTGYEECLAVCSACNEGAEHIYCMQTLLHAVPDDGWLCEGCKLKETAGDLRQVEDQPSDQVHSWIVCLSPKKKQTVKGNIRDRLSARLDKGKGTSQRKVATKGPPNHQLSTKRPGDDTGTTPSAKRQALDSIGGTSPVSMGARALIRETSLKTPDAGKVKFLSPNALASMSGASGMRNFGKSSALAGHVSQSPRPGLSQVAQIATKNRSASNSSISSDSVVGLTSAGVKQIPSTPRPSSLYVTAPSPLATGRSAGSLKWSDPLPSFLVPSRSGSMKAPATLKGSKDGAFESKDGTPVSQTGRGSVQGGSAVASGKNAVKWVDTPRPSTELPSTLPKADPPACLQPLHSTGMPSKTMTSQKSLPTFDAVKSLNNLARLSSFSRVPLSQPSRDDSKSSQEPQASQGTQEDAKLLESSGVLTARVTSGSTLQTVLPQVSSEDSQNVEIVQGLSQKTKGIEEVSKGKLLHPAGTFGDGQRNLGGAFQNDVSVSEDQKKLLKSSLKTPVTKHLLQDETAKTSPKELQFKAKEFKLKNIAELSWPSSKPMASMGSTRCYKCKEIGHSAQACSSRSAATGIAVLATSNTETSPSITSPKDSLGVSSSSLWKGAGLKLPDSCSIGEQKHFVMSSVNIVLPSSVQETERVSPLLVLETPGDPRQILSKRTASGLFETSTNHSSDPKKPVLIPMLPSQGGTQGHQSGQSAGFVTCGDPQSILVGTEKVRLGPVTSVLTDAMKQFTTSPCSEARQVSAISPQNGKFPEGFLSGELATVEASTEAQRLENGTTAILEVPPKFPSHLAQAARGDLNLLPKAVNPAFVPSPILEPPLATPMSVLQSKGLSPWGQVAPPRVICGGKQDARGIRVGVGTGQGIGTPICNSFGSSNVPAVPESHCLWRGGFEVVSATAPAFYDGLQAYSSSFAAPKVRAVAKTLPRRLQLEEVQRLFSADAWPKQFQQKPPTDKEIALYFFVDGESAANFERGYARLLEHMMAHDLVLMGQAEGAEILIFPSNLLPFEYHRWKNKMFLWGVFRARKSNPVSSTSTALDPGQTSANASVHSSSKVLVSGQTEKLSKLGTPVVTSDGDAGEIDMDIDTISCEGPGLSQRPVRKSGWDKPVTKISPPLPPEPAPVQPPPPAQMAACSQERRAAQETNSIEVTTEECASAGLDLPPGFGPAPHKQVPPQIRLPGSKSTSICPPGFPKLRDGVVTVKTQISSAGEVAAGSTTADVENPELNSHTQGTARRDINIAECTRPVTKSRQASPLLAPSPSPREFRDDSGLGASRVSMHRLSHSSSRSPIWGRDRMKDQSGGQATLHTVEKGRDREQDRDTRWEKEKEGGRERHHDRERERERDKERSRDRHKHRDYRYKDRDRGRENKHRRYQRSRSKSQSCSHCHSASRRRPQSPSLSPKRRRSSGKCRSRHRSKSYSDSPDSNHGRPWRKLPSTEMHTESREQWQDLRRLTPHSGEVERHGKVAQEAQDEEASFESRLHVFSGKEDSVPTLDLTRIDRAFKVDRPNVSSFPFYDIHQQDAEMESQNCYDEEITRDTTPHYHMFLSADSGDAQMLEADTTDDVAEQPFFPNVLPCLGRSASNLDLLPKQSLLEIFPSSSREIDKAAECPGYQFFPVEAGNVGNRRVPATNPNLELALGGKDRKSTQNSEPVPFFVRLMDVEGSSPDPSGQMLMANMKEETQTSEVSSPLNLTLSVPQYRKEGNAWVKIETADALIGEEDVDFALTL